MLRILRRHVNQEDGLGALRVLKTAVAGFEPSAQAWAYATPKQVPTDDVAERAVLTA
jgi:hypothetical protein